MIEGIRTSIRQWFEDLFGVRQDALCRYMARLTRTIRDHGITLAYSNIIGPAQGMSVGGLIVLRTDLNPLEELLTLIHEFSHELLHQDERLLCILWPVGRSHLGAVHGLLSSYRKCLDLDAVYATASTFALAL